MKALFLKGNVFSGKGEGARFIELSWVREQIEEKLGFAPFLGTLNIRLVGESIKLRQMLEKASGIEIMPREGFGRGNCFKAFIKGLECAVVIPKIADYPENILEIIASMNLRERFKLKDGDIVEVKVFF